MNQERYTFLKVPEIYYYEFFSEGPKGKIKKVVRYRLIEDSEYPIYNLAFGDWDEETNDIKDLVTTNNQDQQKVLFTVADTVVNFIHTHPHALVFIQGSTTSRTRLYQMGISKLWHEIQLQYSVLGSAHGKWQHFTKDVNYEAFIKVENNLYLTSKESYTMANNSNNNKEANTKKHLNNDQLAKYAKASYFKDKDKQAADFLKKHPVPVKLLK